MEEGRGGHTAQAQGSQVQVSPQGQVGTTQPDMFVVLAWLGVWWESIVVWKLW